MIEALQEMPPGVTGVRVSGRVSGDELREFRPTWEKLVARDEIRLVEVIDSDYEGFGPGWSDRGLEAQLGQLHPSLFGLQTHGRVTDNEWIIHAIHALAWMVPGEIKVFAS